MNKVLEAFISAPSLINARRLVAHVRKHPMVMCMLTEDHVGMVRNAERIIESEKLAVAAADRRQEAREALKATA